LFRYVAVAGDEDDRQGNAGFHQRTLEFQAALTRQTHIEHQAGSLGEAVAVVQQVLHRLEQPYIVTDGAQQTV
jgi:hypothetical protein